MSETEKLPAVVDALAPQTESAYYRKEIESLRAQLLVAQRKAGTAWVPPKGKKPTKRERALAILERPIRDLDWFHLQLVEEGLGAQAGHEVRRAISEKAARDAASGASAASVVVFGHEATPFERARFLEVRRLVTEEWRPRPGIETMLVDHLAQAQWAYEHWMKVHMGLALMPQLPEPDLFAGAQARGVQSPKFQESAEAETHSLMMATRWQNQVMRIVRHLRDLRKASPIVVQNAGQVNVGHQQVNVSADNGTK